MVHSFVSALNNTLLTLSHRKHTSFRSPGEPRPYGTCLKSCRRSLWADACCRRRPCARLGASQSGHDQPSVIEHCAPRHRFALPGSSSKSNRPHTESRASRCPAEVLHRAMRRPREASLLCASPVHMTPRVAPHRASFLLVSTLDPLLKPARPGFLRTRCRFEYCCQACAGPPVS